MPPRPDRQPEACPICGASALRELLRWRMGHMIFGCSRCGLRFAHPLPTDEELARYYQGFLYRKPAARSIPRLIARRKQHLAELFGPGIRSSPGKRFLDYGGGTGITHQAAQQLGLDAFFQDIDEQAIAFVQQSFGVPDNQVLRGDCADTPLRFAYVLADNVIEHVPDPAGMLRALHALLAPGGLLVIKTPHAASGELLFYPTIALLGYTRMAIRHNGLRRGLSMLTSRRTWTCDPPRHLYAFSAAALRALAQMANVPESQVTIGHYHNPLFEYSLAAALISPPDGVAGVLKRILSLPLIPLEIAAKLLQWSLMRCGALAPAGIILTVRKAKASE